MDRTTDGMEGLIYVGTVDNWLVSLFGYAVAGRMRVALSVRQGPSIQARCLLPLFTKPQPFHSLLLCLFPTLYVHARTHARTDLCKPFHLNDIDDGLSEMVTALSPTFTSRFGEIVWAQGKIFQCTVVYPTPTPHSAHRLVGSHAHVSPLHIHTQVASALVGGRPASTTLD